MVFLDLQIQIAPQDQEKITFTCPFGTFAYRRMPSAYVMALTLCSGAYLVFSMISLRVA